MSVERVGYFGIDWVAYTLKYDDFEAAKNYLLVPDGDVSRYFSWLEMVGEAAQISDGSWVEISGLYSYGYGAEHTTGVRVYWDNDIRLGVHVIYSGQALRDVDAIRLIYDVWCIGGKFTRIDAYYDDQSKNPTTVGEYFNRLVCGGYIGRKRKWRHMKSDNGGETLYIGSRTSEAMMRLYDKGAEQGQAAGEWIRAELEIKGDMANGFAQHIGWQYGERAEIDGLINEFIIFPDTTIWENMGSARIDLPKSEKGKRKTKEWGLSVIRTICREMDKDGSYLLDVKDMFYVCGYKVTIKRHDHGLDA